LAQSGSPPPPLHSVIDQNDVDLVSGTLSVTQTMLSIGTASEGMTYTRTLRGKTYRDNLTGTINSWATSSTSNGLIVSIGDFSEKFQLLSDKTFVSTQGRGSTLVGNWNGQTWTEFDYRSAEGVSAKFLTAYASKWPTQASSARIVWMEQPSGERLSFEYKYISNPVQQAIGCDYSSECYGWALRSATSSLGLQIRWLNNDAWTPDAVGINLTATKCDPSAVSCAGVVYPTLGGTYPVPDALYLGRASTYTINADSIIAKRPGIAADLVYSLDSSGQVTSVNNGAGTWTYTYGVGTTTVVGPTGSRRRLTYSSSSQLVSRDWVDSNKDTIEQASEVTAYAHDSKGRLASVTRPEGDKTTYAYDARGNLTKSSKISKSGVGSPIDVSATYSADCSNPKTCNQPLTVTDQRGGVTHFEYSPDHGGVTKMTRPADGENLRPQTRTEYTRFFPRYYRNGSLQNADAPVWRPSHVKQCMTKASCSGEGDEMVKTISRQPTTDANNGFPIALYEGSGDRPVQIGTHVTLDTIGNVLTSDGPIPGSEDKTRYRYDPSRWPVAVIDPDPDGGGPRPHGVLRATYSASGQILYLDQGTTPDGSLGLASWGPRRETRYNAQGYKTAELLFSGNAIQNLTQYTYDSAGDVSCTAVRMNRGAFGSVPDSACLFGPQGAHGPDRITRYKYDGHGRETEITVAADTSDAAVEKINYTPNGHVAKVSDGNNNQTEYAYTGYDNLWKVYYPDPATGQPSNSDYEQYTYDAASNVVTERRRNGQQFNYTYDALNQLRFEDRPGTEPDISNRYDLLGRLRLTYKEGVLGSGLTFTYDVLGRQTAEASNKGTVSSAYNEAGQRTQLTHPDLFAISYDRDMTGAVTAVRAQGRPPGTTCWRVTTTTSGDDGHG
jgi:YD repeat-containing protein